MSRLRIRNWENFQHYKDRCPPWIKLHFEILSSEDWVKASDKTKLLMVVCMLVASRNDGEVPHDPEYLKRVGQLNHEPDLSTLLSGDKPWLQASASATVQASASLRALARGESESESEESQSREEKTPPNPPNRGEFEGGEITTDFTQEILDQWNSQGFTQSLNMLEAEKWTDLIMRQLPNGKGASGIKDFMDRIKEGRYKNPKSYAATVLRNGGLSDFLEKPIPKTSEQRLAEIEEISKSKEAWPDNHRNRNGLNEEDLK